MAYCTKCGAKLRAKDKFCRSCGSAVHEHDSSKRKQVFEGSIHKCPNCGETIGSFTPKCPACGFEFRDTKTSSVIKEFAEKIERLESQKTSPTLSKVAKVFGGGKQKGVEEQVLDTIRNFAVPNTKEDILEFMILASSNINPSVISATDRSDVGANSDEEFGAIKARNDAWLSKFEQVYQKARLSFRDDPDYARISEIYSRTKRKIASAEKEKRMGNLWSLVLVAVTVLACILVFGSGGCSHAAKERALERTVQEIQVDIDNGDYDAALIKAQSLHMDDGWSDESEERWDEQREALIELINEKKAEE